MKTIRTFLFLVLSLLGTGKALAYDFAYNNMYFNLDRTSYTATLTYNTTSYNSYKGEIEIPEIIVGPKDIMYTVTAIGDNALRNSTGVNKITIPGTITSIGSGACYGCTAITTIIVPSSVESIGNDAFYGCSKLATVSLSEGLFTIGSSAFKNTVLKSIVLPESVTSVGQSCFEHGTSSTPTMEKAYLGNQLTTIPNGCFKGQRNLSDVKWSDRMESIGSEAFYNCASLTDVNLGNFMKSVGSSAFRGCTSLQKLTIPASMKSIGSDAFYYTGISTLIYASGCTTTLPTYATKTTKVSFPSSLKSIASKAFYYFSLLAEAILPDGITTIGSSSFEGCSTLMLAKLPSQLTHISDRTFYGCTTLKTIDFPAPLETIGASAFYNCGSLSSLTVTTNIRSIGTDAFLNSGIRELTYEEGVTTTLRTYANKTEKLSLPSTLTSIGPDSFRDFSRLAFADIPGSVTSIDNRAFYGCTVLNLNNIPHSVINIGDRAFCNCTALTLSSIPRSVTTIGSEAFGNCFAIKELSIPSTLTFIGTDAFYNSGVTKLTYMNGCTSTIPTYANHTVTLILPTSVREISPSAFLDFKELTGVTFPKNLETIGTNSFKGCTQLATLTIPPSVTSIGTDAFSGSALTYLIYAPGCKTLLRTYSTRLVSVVIPKSAVSMPADVFQGCSKLEDIFISDLEMWNYLFHDKTSNPIPSDHRLYLKNRLVTVLNADFGMAVMPYAFAGCKELRRVNLTGSVTSVREHAFEGCKYLEAVAMGDRVFSIGGSAFEGCNHLGSVRLGRGVEKIDRNAFSGCSTLSNVHFGGKEKFIGESAFKDCIALENIFLPATLTTIKSDAFSGCTFLQGVSLPDGVTAIESKTFQGCKRLRTVDLGVNVTSLGANAFENCDALQTMQMPESLTAISGYCFNDCDSLRYVYLGSSVASIGEYAFARCPRLVGFYCQASSVPTCSGNAFSESDPKYIDLYVPASSLSAYAGCSPWSSFGSSQAVEGAPRWVQSITLPAPVLLMKEGDTCNISATVTPSDATNQKVNWKSENTAVAYVSNTGLVLANERGSTTITATAADNGGAKALCTVIVDNDYTAVHSLKLSQTSLSLREGAEAYLSAVLTPAVPTYAEVVWSSSDMSVAIVSPFGRVTALKEGTATITCRAADGTGASAQCTLTVTRAVSPEIGDVNDDGVVDNIDINLITRMVLEHVDATGDISLYDLNGDGEITVGDIAGIVEILMGGGEASEISILTLNPSEIAIDTLETYQLECLVLPKAESKSLKWRSNNPEVVTVDNHGLVSGINPGKAMVYVTAADGIADSCSVIVRPVYMFYEDWISTNKDQDNSISSHTYTIKAKKGYRLSFDWMVSSESGCDHLTVTLNDKDILKESGEKSGTYSYAFPCDSTYSIIVKYTKNSDVNIGCDEAIIRNLKVEEGIDLYNGYELVDLGLPSGLMWATCNVGASLPGEHGYYLAWGETTPKDMYDISTYKWCDGTYDSLTKYCSDSKYGKVDNKTVLDPEDDAAHVNWGGNWRMPTKGEQEELRNNCTWTWTSQNGIDGLKLTSKKNGNFIFLPGQGGGDSYWSSTCFLAPEAYELYLSSRYKDLEQSRQYRCYGSRVRPVAPSESYTVNISNISISGSKAKIALGETLQLTAAVTPSDATDKTITWSTSDASIATVSSSGLVTALKAGSVTITATANDAGRVKGTYSLSVKLLTGSLNGHEWVDLDLPSGLKWATCNVGARNPEGKGDTFAWGETEKWKNSDKWKTYKWCNGTSQSLTKYNGNSYYGRVDDKTVLDPEDDAAHVYWGGNWRMPTKAEQDELRNCCTWTWTTLNDVEGYNITSKKNGKSIFLPASTRKDVVIVTSITPVGYYWSSTRWSPNTKAVSLVVTQDVCNYDSDYRYLMLHVRAVCP